MKRTVALLGLVAVLAGCGMAQMAAPMPQGGVGAQAILDPGQRPLPPCPPSQAPSIREQGVRANHVIPVEPGSPSYPTPKPTATAQPKTNAILPPGYKPPSYGCEPTPKQPHIRER